MRPCSLPHLIFPASTGGKRQGWSLQKQVVPDGRKAGSRQRGQSEFSAEREVTSLWLHNCYSLVAFVQRNTSLLPMQEIKEMQVLSLGQEDPLEKDMATHSSILAWEILWTEESGGLPSMGWQTKLDSTEMIQHAHTQSTCM